MRARSTRTPWHLSLASVQHQSPKCIQWASVQTECVDEHEDEEDELVARRQHKHTRVVDEAGRDGSESDSKYDSGAGGADRMGDVDDAVNGDDDADDASD